MELEAVIFMKFGYHAQENENDIIVRKQQEYINAQMIFWGYGGTLCHPLKQIQPFINDMHAKGKKVFLVMSFTKSRPSMESTASAMFSSNGADWAPIPVGIKVTGSKYAIICSNLQKCDFEINLNDYEVAIGPSKGKNASDYIVYRIDKGCLFKKTKDNSHGRKIRIQLMAEITAPFAVLLK